MLRARRGATAGNAALCWGVVKEKRMGKERKDGRGVAGSAWRRPSHWWPPWPPPRPVLLLGGAVQRGRAEGENGVRVLGFSRRPEFLSQRNSLSIVGFGWTAQIGSHRVWARFGPGGMAISRPRPRLRPGKRGAGARLLRGPVFETGPKVKAEKKEEKKGVLFSVYFLSKDNYIQRTVKFCIVSGK